MYIILNKNELLKAAYSRLKALKKTYLWMKQGCQTLWYGTDNTDELLEKAEQLSRQGFDVYYSVNLTTNEKPEGRAGNIDITTVLMLYMDLDIFDPMAHKQQCLPRCIEEAIEFLQSLPYPPSYIVDSGHGLHAYWLLEEPFEISSDTDRLYISSITAGYQSYVKKKALEKYGWQLDSTHDLARVLRLPGTRNYKSRDDPRNVEVIFGSELRYKVDAFEAYIVKPKMTTLNEQNKAGSAALLRGKCAFIQYCKNSAESLPEPFWLAMMSNTARCSDGPEVVHEFSRPYLGYTVSETDAKIKHVLDDMDGPISCDYIRETLQFEGCPQNGCPGVKAPCCWASARVPRARAVVALIQEITPANIFIPEFVGQLAILSEEAPEEYALFRDSCRGKVNLNDLTKAVNKAKNQSRLRIVEPGEQATTRQALTECPVDLIVPSRWQFGETGVILQTAEDFIQVCPVPVVLTKRIINQESGMEKVRVAWLRSGKWHEVTVPRTTAFDSHKVMMLADYGLPLSSENTNLLVRWLSALETANLDALPITKSVSQLGWFGEGKFAPVDNVEIDIEGTSVQGYTKAGTYEKWLEYAKEVRKNPLVRLGMAASFAAPLLELIGGRNFIVYLWGASRFGKTAAIQVALSIWGDPEKLMLNFNATRVGIERSATIHNDLPLGIDERQLAGDKQRLLELFVYMLGAGKGKTRGAKNGGLQNTYSWRTVCLSTGEEPLSSDSSTAGVKTRALEVHGRPFQDENAAKNVYNSVRENHGHAGEVFIRYIQTESKEGIKDAVSRARAIIDEKYPEIAGSHAEALAILWVADAVASHNVFLESLEIAETGAIGFIDEVAKGFETAREMTDVERAKAFVDGLIAQNIAKFHLDTLEVWGDITRDSKHIRIIQHILDSSLAKAGFSQKKLRAEFAEAGYIKTFFTADKKRRYTDRQRINGIKANLYYWNIEEKSALDD